jgi:hypothetical protein
VEEVSGSTPSGSPTSGADDEGNPLGWFVGAAVGVLVAVLCFTPVWDEATSQGGRRGGLAALLQAIGPFGVAGIAIALSVLFLVLGLRSLRDDS